MLSNQATPESRQAFLNEGTSIPLTTSESAYKNFMLGFTSSIRAAGILSPDSILKELISDTPNSKGLLSNMKLWEEELKSHSSEMGATQKSLNFLAGLAGNFADLPSFAAGIGFGKAGYLGGKLLSEGVSKVIPGFSRFSPKAVDSLFIHPLSSAAAMQGFSFAPSVVNNYNPDTDNIHWGGVAEEMAKSAGIGYLLPAVPYLSGVIWRKMNGNVLRETMEAAPHPSDFVKKEEKKAEAEATVVDEKIPEQAIPSPVSGREKLEQFLSKIDAGIAEGKISKQEGEWYKKLVLQPEDIEAHKKEAADILFEKGHPVDVSSKHVTVQIVKPEDLKSLNSAIADQLFSHPPEDIKKSLSDFILHNSFDNFREEIMRTNPEILDGILGFISSTEKQLAKKPEQLIKMRDVVRKLYPEAKREEHPLRQDTLYESLKTGKVNAENISHTIPQNVSARLKQEAEILKQKNMIKNFENEFSKTGKTKYKKKIAFSEKKIKELEKKLSPLMEHNEEIAHIRKTLLTEEGTAKQFKTSHEYNRLYDLTRVSNSARQLMHELHVTHEYEKQHAIKEFLSSLTQLARSNISRLADPKRVSNYMRERVEGALPELKETNRESLLQEARQEVKAEKVEAKSAEGEVSKADSQLAEQEAQVSKSGSKEIKKEYKEAQDRFKQFKSSEQILKNFIACLQGAVNAKT